MPGAVRHMDAVVLLSLKTGMLPHWSLVGCVGALRFMLRLLQNGHDAPIWGGMKQLFTCSANLCRGSFGVMFDKFETPSSSNYVT